MKKILMPYMAACVLLCACMFCPGSVDALEGIEENARETQKGLWHDKNPIPPWN